MHSSVQQNVRQTGNSFGPEFEGMALEFLGKYLKNPQDSQKEIVRFLMSGFTINDKSFQQSSMEDQKKAIEFITDNYMTRKNKGLNSLRAAFLAGIHFFIDEVHSNNQGINKGNVFEEFVFTDKKYTKLETMAMQAKKPKSNAIMQNLQKKTYNITIQEQEKFNPNFSFGKNNNNESNESKINQDFKNSLRNSDFKKLTLNPQDGDNNNFFQNPFSEERKKSILIGNKNNKEQQKEKGVNFTESTKKRSGKIGVKGMWVPSTKQNGENVNYGTHKVTVHNPNGSPEKQIQELLKNKEISCVYSKINNIMKDKQEKLPKLPNLSKLVSSKIAYTKELGKKDNNKQGFNGNKRMKINLDDLQEQMQEVQNNIPKKLPRIIINQQEHKGFVLKEVRKFNNLQNNGNKENKRRKIIVNNKKLPGDFF